MPPDLYYDRDAIDFLARQLDRDEVSASSHWRQMHETFRYADGRLSGLRGFGTFTPRSRWIASLAHRLLQQPWRRMGRAFPGFRRIDKITRAVALRQGRIYDLDVLRQSLTAAYLETRVPAALTAGKFLLVIGDGFGTLSSIALAAFPGLRVVAVNLVKSLLVDMSFVARAVPGIRTVLVTGTGPLAQALDHAEAKFIAIRADDWALVGEVPAALAVNIASMQEMDPQVIGQYFRALRAGPETTVFYCCNREEKRLPDGTTVRFRDYPWRPEDQVLDDGPCPWHQRYYSARPPFFHFYDGPIRHRLAVLARDAP